jgi:hypothetical protein
MEAACSGHAPELPRKALSRRHLGRGGESRECKRRIISSLLQMRRATSWREGVHAIPQRKRQHCEEKGDETFHRFVFRMLVESMKDSESWTVFRFQLAEILVLFGGGRLWGWKGRFLAGWETIDSQERVGAATQVLAVLMSVEIPHSLPSICIFLG